jgi:hypothetical protein
MRKEEETRERDKRGGGELKSSKEYNCLPHYRT